MRNDEAADIELHVQEVWAAIERLYYAVGHSPNLTIDQSAMLIEAASKIDAISAAALGRRAA